ncbi:MAG: HAMP domain-containing protein, partial [Kofleriaceae bacterium]|nr:HAMP domain-containing protein [Kofleriaceae bacterium]
VKLTEAIRARDTLLEAEARLIVSLTELADSLRMRTERIAGNLERNARRLRLFTGVMGVIAVAIGLLITTWVILSLRPLGRLNSAARRIAAGDYASRIDERGPAEVADLAREFNAMGRAVEERQREVVRAERLAAVGKMAAMITHEVRNPLSSIGLNAELLEEELAALNAGDEARQLCHAIGREVDRLTAITEEYLTFARLPTPRLAAGSVVALVDDLARFVKDDLASRGVTLTVAHADGLPPARLDEGQIRQSLMNLVRNAAEAVGSRGGGNVWIRTRADDDGVAIEVADDGPGIAPELRDRLFDPFVSTKDGGTGLGLALSHQIVRDHGGALTVASPPGAGATFTVRLPRA